MVGASARTMGIDLADLRKIASEAGDSTPFLVIQPIGKKSTIRLTSISRLEKWRETSAQAHSPAVSFTHPLMFHRSHVMRGRSTCGVWDAPRDLMAVFLLTPCPLLPRLHAP